MEPGRADTIESAVERSGRYRWSIVALLFVATVINYVDRQMIGVLKPTLSADLDWTETDYANVIFFFQMAYAIGYLGFGRLVDVIGAGTFDLRFVGGYLDRLEQIATPGAVVENNVDQIFRPKYNFTVSPTWTTGPLTLSYNLRWQDGVRRFSRIDTAANPSLVDPRYFRYRELWQHEVQAQIEINDRFAFYGGVNNLADQKPDIGFETNVPISPVGRFIYLGAKLRYGER